MIRPAQLDDQSSWVLLRHALWPDVHPGTHAAEMADLLDDPDQAALIAEHDGAPCGFVEVAIRPWAEACGAGPVGYIEGWYVAPDIRRQGVGRALVRAAEEWAISRGCRWMASDTEIENTLSQTAHAALGYRAVGSLVHFARPLGEPRSGPRGFPHVWHPETYTVVRLPRDEALPAWVVGPFVSVTRTQDELSVVCRAGAVPPGVRHEPGWSCLRVAGTLDFALVGALSSLVGPLAAAGVSVFAVSTFDTDYLLVREGDVNRTWTALERAGHRFTFG